MKKARAVVLLVALVAPGFAQKPGVPEERARRTLGDVSSFAIGGVGVAGWTSTGELAYRTLLRSPRAESTFRAVLRDPKASAPGKLYALLGLREKAPNVFTQEVAAFLSHPGKVYVMSGCIRSTATIADVAKRIQKGDFSPKRRPARP